jgi:tetratricopeptide (TPR) repeat protein
MYLCHPLILCLLLMPASGVAAAGQPPIDDVMVAEFALQQGDLSAAARSYLAAALASGDPEVAERATRVAFLAEQPGLAGQAIARWRALVPESPAMRAAAVHFALARGEHESALEDAVAMLALPDEAGYPALLAILAESRGDAMVIARSVMRELFAQQRLPGNLSAWLRFAGLARRLDDREFSDRVVDAGLAKFPDDPRAQLLTASRLRDAGEPQAAREALLALNASGRLPPELRRAAASELALLGDTDLAARVLSEGPQDDASLGQRAVWLVQAEDQAGLRALYRELGPTAPAPTVSRKLLLGHVAEALGDWELSAGWYRSIGPGPGHDMARLRLARVLDQAGRLEDAVAVLQDLQADDLADGEQVRDSHLYEAEMLVRAGLGARALATLGRGLAVFEDDPELLYARALQYERADEVESALADLRRIISDNPLDAQALNAYGYTLAERRMAYAEALPYVQRAHVLEPDSAPILDSLGWIELRLGRGDTALELLQRAWDLLKDAEIAAHLGEALWLAGREEEARDVWAAGIELNPANPALREVLDRLTP